MICNSSVCVVYTRMHAESERDGEGRVFGRRHAFDVRNDRQTKRLRSMMVKEHAAEGDRVT